jgi:hypothetical protein
VVLLSGEFRDDMGEGRENVPMLEPSIQNESARIILE